jgi:hypothetical protein
LHACRSTLEDPHIGNAPLLLAGQIRQARPAEAVHGFVTPTATWKEDDGWREVVLKQCVQHIREGSRFKWQAHVATPRTGLKPSLPLARPGAGTCLACGRIQCTVGFPVNSVLQDVP